MTNTAKLNKDILTTRVTDFAQMKKLIWLYFILLIFEGALRKWILPGLSDVLLIVRDPVALYILIKAAKHNIFINNPYFVAAAIISVISFFTAFFFGHGNMVVATFGIRIMLLHFPLIFVIGRVFNHDDVLQVGKVLLLMAPFMAVLIGLQFYSPQYAWVNRGLRGSLEGAGFAGANGYMRPPGVFSFTSGNSAFWGLVGAYLFYFWLHAKRIKQSTLIIVTASVIAAMSFSISRSLFFGLLVSVGFLLAATARKPNYFWSIVFALIGVAVVGLLIMQFSLFNTGFDAFTSRFEQAGSAEGGLKGTLVDRFLGGMYGAIRDTPNFWGQGLGMGTNAGAKIMTGRTDFLIAEGEWGRIIGETGFVLGLGLILVRVILSFQLIQASYTKIAKGDALPWMLMSYGLLNLLQGQWAQPTSLGFSVFTGGLVMAALKTKRKPAPQPSVSGQTGSKGGAKKIPLEDTPSSS